MGLFRGLGVAGASQETIGVGGDRWGGRIRAETGPSPFTGKETKAGVAGGQSALSHFGVTPSEFVMVGTVFWCDRERCRLGGWERKSPRPDQEGETRRREFAAHNRRLPLEGAASPQVGLSLGRRNSAPVRTPADKQPSVFK